MPILPPPLDDRSYDDLVAELVSRIPAHTPEWTNPVPGDPGRTLLELFAWLADTVLYRANLVPERQRLAFLRLLGAGMRPAAAARGLVSIASDDEEATDARMLAVGARLDGPAPFETVGETAVLPVTAQAFRKRPLDAQERTRLQPVVDGLRQLYRISTSARPYVTAPVFAGGVGDADGLDLVGDTVDGALWLALFAAKAERVEAIRATLAANPQGGRQVVDVGVAPALAVPALFEEIGPRAVIPHAWDVTLVDAAGVLAYRTLDVVSDGTHGLTQRGVIRLALPGSPHIAAPTNDVRRDVDAGVGGRPPRLDDPKLAARLVTWLRLRPTATLHALRLSWVGVNAATIDGRQTITARVVAQSDGTADQQVQLPARSVERETLSLQVESRERGYEPWLLVDDLGIAAPDSPWFTMDGEAGTVRFGDGLRGRIPEVGMRVRVERMRAGGGGEGNLPPLTLAAIQARDLRGAPVPKLKVLQGLATDGGADAETLDEAERRIPALFRDHDRAVTELDYRRVAASTPGVRMGRVEVMPRFRPQQRRFEVPGVVTVMVLPFRDGFEAPAPRPDRPFLETVHAYLDARRPLATELYTIACEYVPVAVSVSVSLRDGVAQETVLQAVRDAVRGYLWPLAPGGDDGTGWSLGRAVRERELDVVVSRVPGVAAVNDMALFTRAADGTWTPLRSRDGCAPLSLPLLAWQLPELLAVVAVADAPEAPLDLTGTATFAGARGADGARGEVAVPVVPELC